MPKLKIMMPETGEVTHELVDEVITLGGSPTTWYRSRTASVSSRHAQLNIVEGGNYHLQDLGSTNGTRVNARRSARPSAQRRPHPFRLGRGVVLFRQRRRRRAAARRH